MSQGWFDSLRHPLSEDEETDRRTTRTTRSVSLRDSYAMGTMSRHASPIMDNFFYYLKLYSYELLKTVYDQAKSFYERQSANGMPSYLQKDMHSIYIMSLDFCVQWPPAIVQSQIDKILKSYTPMYDNWPKAFTLFLLQYYDREESALAALRTKGVSEGKIFPNVVVRCPGEVKVVQPPFQEFLVGFIKYLVNYATIRNERTMRDERYQLIDDAANFAMQQTMIDITQKYTECIMDTSVLEISLKNQMDRQATVRASDGATIASRRDSHRDSQKGTQKGTQRGSQRAASMIVPPADYFKDVQVPDHMTMRSHRTYKDEPEPLRIELRRPDARSNANISTRETSRETSRDERSVARTSKDERSVAERSVARTRRE